MKIEIWSDILCPFCYIGKRHLEKAIETLPYKDELEIEWKSFQLDPNLPTEALEMNKEEYLASRGYAVEQVQGMFQQLVQTGKPIGIEFNQDEMILANSKRGHALIHYAAQFGKATEVKEALLKAHFTDAKNIAAEEVLKAIASEQGMDAEEAWKYIIEGKADQAIVEDIAMAQQIGVRGVPFFVFNQKYAVSGAQPIDTFKEVIEKAYSEIKPKIEVLDFAKGDESLGTCGPDGCEI